MTGRPFAVLLALPALLATACSGQQPAATGSATRPEPSAAASASSGPLDPAPLPSGAASASSGPLDPAPLPSAAVPAPPSTGAPGPAAIPPAEKGLTAPLAPPPGPVLVRTTPTALPQPGTLQTVDWEARTHADSGCRPARTAAVSYGDLDADGRDEAAVPRACSGNEPVYEVLVYTGEPTAPKFVGAALSPEQRERVHAVEFRDRYLVVTTLAYSGSDPSGQPDTAVTTRWVLRSGVLERTDRYEDPAFVLETDEE